jgi:hypothetical protein
LSLEEPLKTSGSFWKPVVASGKFWGEESLGAAARFREPLGASRIFCEIWEFLEPLGISGSRREFLEASAKALVKSGSLWKISLVRANRAWLPHGRRRPDLR